MLKISGYVKVFKIKEWDKDKNNKLMIFYVDDAKNIKPFGLRLKNHKILSYMFYQSVMIDI